MKTFLHALAFWLSGAIALAFAPAAVAQQGSGERAVIEIVPIMHRDPGQVRERVRSALDARGSIGQIDDKLIIATTATNFLQLQALIAETDVPPRRLVIGVDFAHQRDAEDPGTQQQSQAIEGQELVFVASAASTDDEVSATDTADPAPGTDNSGAPRIIIAAEILDDSATVNLSLDNVPGLNGNHIVRVPLGVWQRIDMPVPGNDIEPETSPATVAVRVDRVP